MPSKREKHLQKTLEVDAEYQHWQTIKRNKTADAWGEDESDNMHWQILEADNERREQKEKSRREISYFKTQKCTNKNTYCVYGFLKNGIAGYAHIAINNGKLEMLAKQLEMYHCTGLIRLAHTLTAKQARNTKLRLLRLQKSAQGK